MGKRDMQEKNIAWGFETISFLESFGGCLDVAISRAMDSKFIFEKPLFALQPASIKLNLQEE